MKWSLNRISYYKTFYTNLHYFNVYVGHSDRQLSNSIEYCKYYQPSMDTLAIESPLACHLFLFTHQIINDYLIYLYVYKLMFVKWHSFFKYIT